MQPHASPPLCIVKNEIASVLQEIKQSLQPFSLTPEAEKYLTLMAEQKLEDYFVLQDELSKFVLKSTVSNSEALRLADSKLRNGKKKKKKETWKKSGHKKTRVADSSKPNWAILRVMGF